MKNSLKFIGIFALTALIGFTMIGCEAVNPLPAFQPPVNGVVGSLEWEQVSNSTLDLTWSAPTVHADWVYIGAVIFHSINPTVSNDNLTYVDLVRGYSVVADPITGDDVIVVSPGEKLGIAFTNDAPNTFKVYSVFAPTGFGGLIEFEVAVTAAIARFNAITTKTTLVLEAFLTEVGFEWKVADDDLVFNGALATLNTNPGDRENQAAITIGTLAANLFAGEDTTFEPVAVGKVHRTEIAAQGGQWEGTIEWRYGPFGTGDKGL